LAKKTGEFPLLQLASVVLTSAGFLLCLYFFVLLNSLISDSDIPIKQYYTPGTEASVAIPYGGLIMGFGLCLVLVGIILNVTDIIIKRREKRIAETEP
jgi:hypothetical protein